MPYTITDKIWQSHEIAREDEFSLLYIDRHLTHEVTSPVAFSDMRQRGYRVRRPDLSLAVMDHNVPTDSKENPTMDDLSKKQMDALWDNSKTFNVPLLDFYSPYQGIIHVIGPELGFSLPGLTIAAGDSHTSTHGALGSVAFGIGTSEVEHVFVTQTLWIKKPKQFRIKINGKTRKGVSAKDLALYIIGKIGTGGGIGHIIEYSGETVSDMEVEGRMTLCNMSIEAGARSAIIEPDEKVFSYVKDAPLAPKGQEWEEAVDYWRSLKSDPNARYDKELEVDASSIKPMVTWGTNPSMVARVDGIVPDPSEIKDQTLKDEYERALKYMGLKPGQKITDINVDYVFIGSCTNARLSDLIEAAKVLKGKKVSKNVKALAVPGSEWVKRKAERMGLHRIYIDAGFEWRHSGCSMCIAMNSDRLPPGKRSASTSNRNFENRQGPGGRTHLVSPAMAAAAAVYGHFVDLADVDIAEVL
ncbi:MAG: 3-isopropylmalate dehydratase large subunit [Nitrososphaeria archaeon]|nr:3-isopropylmalate dehydratase large subunit [Conexivisphaerales archaeon]